MHKRELSTCSTYYLQTIEQIKGLIKVWNDSFDVLCEVNKRNGMTPDTKSLWGCVPIGASRVSKNSSGFSCFLPRAMCMIF